METIRCLWYRNGATCPGSKTLSSLLPSVKEYHLALRPRFLLLLLNNLARPHLLGRLQIRPERPLTREDHTNFGRIEAFGKYVTVVCLGRQECRPLNVNSAYNFCPQRGQYWAKGGCAAPQDWHLCPSASEMLRRFGAIARMTKISTMATMMTNVPNSMPGTTLASPIKKGRSIITAACASNRIMASA